MEPRVLLAADLVNDSYSAHQNADPRMLNVLKNDVFAPGYEGERKITSVSLGSQGGSISIAANGKSLTYSPPADYVGSESITYVVDNQASAKVSVQIYAPLRQDLFTVHPDRKTHTLDVLANDPFWKTYTGNREITFTSTTASGGELHIAEDGKSVTYRAPDFNFGRDSFVYIVDGKYPARVRIEVPNPINNDRLEIEREGETRQIDVLANDPFWPDYDGAREITFVDVVSGQGVMVNSDGSTLSIKTEPGMSDYVLVRYVVDSQFEGSVNVVRKPHSSSPSRDTKLFEMDQDSNGMVIDVFHDDGQPWYPDRGITEVGATSQGGKVTIRAEGRQLVYVPPAGFVGQDSFTYVVKGRISHKVLIDVSRSVRDDSFTYPRIYQDTPDNRLRVLLNDFFFSSYTGDRKITDVSDSEHGGQLTITADGRSVYYAPPAGYTGPDSFSYTVDDNLTAQVTLEVTPLVQSDKREYYLETPFPSYVMPVLANDNFRYGYPGPAEITEIRGVPEGDRVEILDDRQSIRFFPGSTGHHQFTYVVDGLYEGVVTVSVGGYTIGDFYVVDQNSDAVVHNVMANDFQSGYSHRRSISKYQGDRQITDASPSREGGTVVISDDGKQVHYTPPVDFVGVDQYTYTVDGLMQTTVRLQVIRQVRDDLFHVLPGQQDRLLPVLANDLFGADYRDARVVTDVSSSQIGATVRIAPSGDGVLYSAPDGFVGTGTLWYQVDGQLKAEVTIEVRPDQAPTQPRFESLDEYSQFLIDDAMTRYDDLFGRDYYPYSMRAWLDSGVDVPAGPMAPEGRDHSETNIQVEGVDEADLIEVDADYLYVLRGSDLIIAQASPAEDLSLLSQTKIAGFPVGQYLHGDRLTVVSQSRGGFGTVDRGIRPISPIIGPSWGYPNHIETTTFITVLDVSDRSSPQLVQRTEVNGRYVQSRAIDDFVYVVVDDRGVAPEPKIIFPDEPDEDARNAGDPRGTYETREQYLARITENVGQLIQDTLPNYSSYGADGQLVRSGLMSQPEDVYKPFAADATNLLSVVSIDIMADEPGLSSNVTMYVDDASVVYGSLSSLYVFASDSTVEDGAITRIVQFSWDRQTGGVAYQATGQVPGSLINQFSADEHDGYLRIATTVSHVRSGNWTDRRENDLFVLQSSGGLLQTVGSLTNLTPDETIRSVRFFGSQAYVVTFRGIDPLFVIDFAQPTRPIVAGHVTLPGFSSYLQVIAPDRVLGVGRNTATGTSGPTQVSLFDTSDPARPRLLDQYTFSRFSTSITQDDHHAVRYFATHQILAMPRQGAYVHRIDRDGDGYPETRKWAMDGDLVLLRIDPDSLDPEIVQLATIEHSARVLQSGYIGDKLYSVSEDAIKVVDVNDPTTLVAEVSIPPADPIPIVAYPTNPPYVIFQPALSPFTTLPTVPVIPPWAMRARQDLAERLGVSEGAPLMVVAEPTAGNDAEAGQVVFRVGDREYLYRAVDEQTVELVDDHYEFVRPHAFPGWHNFSQPEDVNGDAEVSPADVLAVVHEIDAYGGGRQLPVPGVMRQIHSPFNGEDWSAHLFLDTNGDGYVSPTDALRVIQTLESLQGIHNPAAMAASAFSVQLDEPKIENRQTLDDGSIDRLFELVDSTEAGDPPQAMTNRFDAMDSQTVDRAIASHNTEIANTGSSDSWDRLPACRGTIRGVTGKTQGA